MSFRAWGELTTEDFTELDAERWVAVLPVAATEQHGPHLPLNTDTIIAEGVLNAALTRLPEDFDGLILTLPTQAVGASAEHTGFPGTLSIQPDTLTAHWTQIGESVAAAGLRKLMILNAHGGQPQVVDLAAMALRRGSAMLVARANTFGLGLPPGLVPEDELAHGLHGGAVETSIMLHLRPDRVRIGEVQDFVPLGRRMAEEGYRVIGPEATVGLAWAAQDLHPEGVAGRARDANAELGRAIVEHAAQILSEALVELCRLPLSSLVERPGGDG
jgi:creatinine amidohydrolase